MVITLKSLRIAACVMAGGLILCACSDRAETGAAGAAPDHVLAKVDLDQPVRVLGTEPFWSLDISPASLTYESAEGDKHLANNTGPSVAGAAATWKSQTQAGTAIEVVLTAQDCSDGMSDRIYPLSATVKVGDAAFSGCAASVTAIDTAGESGRVE